MSFLWDEEDGDCGGLRGGRGKVQAEVEVNCWCYDGTKLLVWPLTV